MGVNIEKLIAKKKDMDAKKPSNFPARDYFYYKTVNGSENHIRLMPPWTDEGVHADSFFREVFIHYNVGPVGERGASFACPAKSEGSESKECPICEEVARLKATEDPLDMEHAAKMRAKQQFISNVVDLNDPVYTKEDIETLKQQNPETEKQVGQTKVQVFFYGPTIWDGLFDLFNDGIDLTDLEDGLEIKITREGQGRETKYRVRAVLKSKPFSFKKTTQEDALVALEKVMDFQDTDRMQKAIDGELFSSAKTLDTSSKEDVKVLAAKLKVKVDEDEESEEEDGEDDDLLAKLAKSL